MAWPARPAVWMALGVIVVACGGSPSPDTELPAGTRAISSNEVPDQELARVAAIQSGDSLFLLETPAGPPILIRTRPDRPGLMLATSCDVLTSVELPEDWEGRCLEYTWNSRRVTGVFPHGTRSVGTPDQRSSPTPVKAAAVAAGQIVPSAEFQPVGDIVHIPSGGPADLRVLIDQHGFCQWFGVNGAGAEWQASPALACVDPSR